MMDTIEDGIIAVPITSDHAMHIRKRVRKGTLTVVMAGAWSPPLRTPSKLGRLSMAVYVCPEKDKCMAMVVTIETTGTILKSVIVSSPKTMTVRREMTKGVTRLMFITVVSPKAVINVQRN